MDKKIWCSFGDSITYQEMWQPFVCEAVGLHHINCGVGSTTVGIPASGKITRPAFYSDARLGLGKYENTLTCVTADGISYNLLIPSNPDIITIMGGSNDMYYAYRLGDVSELSKRINEKNLYTYIGAYSYIIETLLRWKPDVSIFILSTVWSSPLENMTPVFSFEEYVQVTEKIAEYYSLPFVDVFNKSGINSISQGRYCQSDFVHPNSLGGKRIADVLLEEFKNRGIHYV